MNAHTTPRGDDMTTPRTITTAAELDALPVARMVISSWGGGEWHKRRDGKWISGAGDLWTSAQMAQDEDEYVLHDPSAPAREDGEVERLERLRDAAAYRAERDAARAEVFQVVQERDKWKADLDAARAEVAALRAGVAGLCDSYEGRGRYAPDLRDLRALLDAPAPEAAPPAPAVTREQVRTIASESGRPESVVADWLRTAGVTVDEEEGR
jgi:hypothetical protein